MGEYDNRDTLGMGARIRQRRAGRTYKLEQPRLRIQNTGNGNYCKKKVSM